MMKKFLLMVMVIVAGATSHVAYAAESGHTADKPSPEEALTMLKEGNARFVAGESKYPHVDQARRALAAGANQGNYAYATVLSCADSRVPVEFIFDAGVMDLFVIRVAGNVCDVDEIGTIEYGVAHVNTPVVVVLGHSACGAVTAVKSVVQGEELKLERNIPELVDNIIAPVSRVVAEAGEDADQAALLNEAIEENVWHAIYELFRDSPATRALVEEGKVKVVGAVYEIGTGEVQWLDEDKPMDILEEAAEDPAAAEEPYAK